jgi:hypothetical protein
MSSPEEKNKAPKQEWAPRMWQGCILQAWLRLLVKNKLFIHPGKLYIGCNISAVSTIHLGLRLLQDAWYGNIPSKTKIDKPPVFIIGHWRTGTTLMHELMILDPRNTFPNTYHCLDPNHFLLTEEIFKNYFNFLLPSKRPMDNMEAGWDRPQEDEFALCMMGQPSPYLSIAFPNNPETDPNAFEIEKLHPKVKASWKKAFGRFLSEITFTDNRRLVLKSPTHTARIPTLLEMFPDARFIHIVRDPYVVYPSTVNLWKSLHRTHGMQTPAFQGIEEKVLREFELLYGCVERDKKLVAPNRFIEIRYEDLMQDPFSHMEQIYEKLELGDIRPLVPHLKEYLDNRKDYKTNKYKSLKRRVVREINERWGHVIDRYGYDRKDPEMCEV